MRWPKTICVAVIPFHETWGGFRQGFAVRPAKDVESFGGRIYILAPAPKRPRKKGKKS